MNEIHRTPNSVEAHFLRGLLQSNGIDAFVLGDDLTAMRSQFFFSNVVPLKVCIYDAARMDEAKSLVSAYFEGSGSEAPAGEAWLCPKCQERLEAQFTLCWQCGTEREL